MSEPTVALVHDYLTQRGGAERVALSMTKAFPEAPLYTSLYQPDTTLPEFGDVDVRTLALNRAPALRRHHRWALPLLAPAFSRLEVRADVVVCSSSGWAHGVRTGGAKIVYCHSPAKWLYETRRYLRHRPLTVRLALAGLAGPLRAWDGRAAASAQLYLANSRAVRDEIRRVYGIDASVLPPPPTVDPAGPRVPPAPLDAGFHLCVSRLLPYKNVDVVVEAFREMPDERLVVVGAGPDRARLRRRAGRNVTMLERVSDEGLRWLYAHCAALVSAAYEDFGLAPLEAASFGRPAVTLRAGGFLDTVVEGETGVFFDEPEPGALSQALAAAMSRCWDPQRIRAHAEGFSEERFIAQLRQIVLG